MDVVYVTLSLIVGAIGGYLWHQRRINGRSKPLTALDGEALIAEKLKFFLSELHPALLNGQDTDWRSAINRVRAEMSEKGRSDFLKSVRGTYGAIFQALTESAAEERAHQTASRITGLGKRMKEDGLM